MSININDYQIGSEKSQFSGYRPVVKHKSKGTVLYLGQTAYKTAKAAEGEAEAYLDGYGKINDRTADRFARDYRKNNRKEIQESLEINEDVHNDLNEIIVDFQRKLMRMNKTKLDQSVAKEINKIDSMLDDLRSGTLFKIRPGR